MTAAGNGWGSIDKGYETILKDSFDQVFLEGWIVVDWFGIGVDDLPSTMPPY